MRRLRGASGSGSEGTEVAMSKTTDWRILGKTRHTSV